MPTINRSFNTSVDAIDAKIRQLANSTNEAEDLVYLSKAVEALNVPATISGVVEEGEDQVALVEAEGTTQVSLVRSEGATQLDIIQDAGSVPVNTKTDGETLERAKINIVTSGTYYLPLASSMSEGEYLIVEKQESNRLQSPTINVALGSSDTIIYSRGSDTSVLFNLNRPITIRFTSNGIDSWRI